MQRRQVRRLKIRQLLLLILRMLIILTIVLAFARPASKGGSIGSHASVSAVILFDNSASMNRSVRDGNLFEIAKKRVGGLLDSFSDADEISLIPLNKSATDIPSMAFRAVVVVREELQRLVPGHGEANLQAALEQATDLLDNAANLNKELYIVTDRQRHSLPDSTVLKGHDIHVYLVALPLDEPDNCGITAVDLGGKLLLPGHEFTITATVKNYSKRDRDDIIASLYLDGNRVAQSDVKISAGGETAVRFTRSVSRGGFHSGYVELTDDSFSEDNRFFFSFRIPAQFNILIVADNVDAKFISLALVPSKALNQYWSVKEIAPDNMAGVNFIDYDVIIYSGSPKLTADYTKRLKSIIRLGKSLFMIYDGTTDISYLNNTWSDVTGVVFDEPVQQQFTRAGYYTLESMNYDHPIFSAFGFNNDKLPTIKFFTLPKVHTTGKAVTIAKFSGNRPALVENSYSNGTVLTFTAPLSPRYSDLTGHAFFVPFISRIAEYLASDLSSFDHDLFCEESITRIISVNYPLTGSVEFITPDSSRYFLTPEEEQGNLILRASPTTLPGIYYTYHLGREVDRFAVNVLPAECDLTSVDTDRFAEAIGAREYNELTADVDAASVIDELRYGKELWQIFLWLAVVLLLLEMLLSRGAVPEE